MSNTCIRDRYLDFHEWLIIELDGLTSKESKKRMT